MNRRASKENRIINKVWLIEGPFSFKAKRKEGYYRKERFYLFGFKAAMI
jgi:hypothetical protein